MASNYQYCASLKWSVFHDPENFIKQMKQIIYHGMIQYIKYMISFYIPGRTTFASSVQTVWNKNLKGILNSLLNGTQLCLLQHLWSKAEHKCGHNHRTTVWQKHFLFISFILIWFSIIKCDLCYSERKPIASYESMSWSMKKLGVHKNQSTVPDNDWSSCSVMWPGLQSWNSAEMRRG